MNEQYVRFKKGVIILFCYTVATLQMNRRNNWPKKYIHTYIAVYTGDSENLTKCNVKYN